MKTYNIRFKYQSSNDIGDITIIAESKDSAMQLLYEHLELSSFSILSVVES